MDFDSKNSYREKKERKSKNGHTIINVPSETTQYITNRNNNIDLSNDHDDDNYHGTNNHIRDINNPGDGSDSSNFSGGNPVKRRQQQSDKDRKIRHKRQQTKDNCAASQQQWDNKRQQACTLDGAYKHASKPKGSFDGVRIDAPMNKAAAKLINDAQRSVNNDNQQSRHTKKTSRGKNHNTSSIANLERPGSKRGRRQKQQPYDPFAGGNIGDPLDEAMSQQGTSRKSSRGSSGNYTKMMGQHMDKITRGKWGAGKTATNRQKKKSKATDEVIDVDSDERTEGSGKKRKKTSPFFDSPSSSSVVQGDDEFHAEGDWDSQGSGGRNDDIMAALDGANKYADVNSLKPQRDPKKKSASKRRSYTKPTTKTPTPRFKNLTKNERDELKEYSDNDSSAGHFGESKRSNNKPPMWLNSNRGKGRTLEQKSYPKGKKKPSNQTQKKLVKMGMREDTDKEWKDAGKLSSLGSTNTRQTRSRSRSRKSKKKDEVIEILDSSSEEESSEDEAISIDDKEISKSVVVQPSRKRPPIGDLFTIDAARIAVGKKVVKSKCELKFQFGAKEQYMLFSWNNNKGKKKEHKVSLKQDSELVGLNYYVPEEDDNSESVLTDGVDDSMTIIAFKIKPTEENELTIYTQSYDADSYITVEVRDTDQFLAMLEQMRVNPTLETFFCCDPKIEFYDLKEYTAALIEDTEKENNNRRRSTRLSRANAKKKSITSEKPILVFPFKADDDEFSTAASKLNELKLAREQTSVESERASIQPQDSNLNESQGENENERVKGSARTHYITIRDDDMERLEPGEFLNDSLVDFWMKWISGTPNNPNSDVHVFTSHFMSTLASDGAKAVSSWTAKKKIDIFEKKLIFVPVNSDLHWSLCVIVNPGFIANNYDEEIYDSKFEEGSFLLFLDSLKMHQKNKIARNIYGWLNFEWKRLKKRGGKDFPKQPFDKSQMPVLTPTIPYQDNGCDCGVFVCRYAYNLFQMRDNCFSQFDLSDNCKDLFEYRGLFKFGMNDIARIRVEMDTLIRNLSTVYVRMKKLEKAKKKSKSTSNEADGNSSSEAAAAEETTDVGNTSEGVDESFDSNEDNLATVKREDENRETSGDESPFVPKEKENVENSSDTSKNYEEEDRSSSDNEKSQDLLEDDESSVAC